LRLTGCVFTADSVKWLYGRDWLIPCWVTVVIICWVPLIQFYGSSWATGGPE